MRAPTTDAATRTVSAFHDFAALAGDCWATGYVPTLRRDRLAVGRKGSRLDVATATLRAALHRAMLPVWPAWGTYPDEVVESTNTPRTGARHAQWKRLAAAVAKSRAVR